MRILAASVLVGFMLTGPASTRETRFGQTQPTEAIIESAIFDLGSADAVVRANAKKTLIQIGPAVKAKLVEALKSQVENLNLVYTGPDRWEQTRFRGAQLYELYDIVAKMRIEQAIPLLISVAEESFDHGRRGCEPFVRALVEIGPASVRPLVKSLGSAREIAERNKHRIHMDSQMRLVIDVDSQIIQMRAARALGDLGDVLALPVLERLYSEEKLGDYWMAIQLIKKKNGMKYERWPDKSEVEPFCAD